MNAVRGTFRPWVVVALLVWVIGLGTAIIFNGQSVSNLLSCDANPCSPDAGGWPWEAIWLVGILAILAIGFLTRKRA